jgi:hypothetical protein
MQNNIPAETAIQGFSFQKDAFIDNRKTRTFLIIRRFFVPIVIGTLRMTFNTLG